MSFKFKSGPPERKKRSRFGIAPSDDGKNKVPPPAVVHIESLGGKSNEQEQSTTSQGIDFNSLPCTTYPPYDAYETKETLDPKEAAKRIAAAAAAKINANLVAKGKIKLSELIPEKPLLTQKPQTPPLHSHQTVPERHQRAVIGSSVPAALTTTIVPPIKSTDISRNDDFFISQVEINDIPIGCRNYLTRTITQDKITQTTKAYVCTKGKYMSPAEKALAADDEKPLYLHVQATEPQFVQHALDRIKQIIGNHYQKKMGMQTQVPPPPPTYSYEPSKPPSYPNFAAQANTATAAPLPATHFVQEKVFIGLDEAPTMFDLRSRLLGVNYQNFNFIGSETGAQVILRGRGSGYIEPTTGQESYEAMYAFICHHTNDGVEAAKSLVLSLVNTIQKDLDQYLMSYTTTNNPVAVAMNPNLNSYYQNYSSNMAPPPPPVPAPAKSSASHKPIKRKFTEETPDTSTVLGYLPVEKRSFTEKPENGTNLTKKFRENNYNTDKEDLHQATNTARKSDDSATFKSPGLPFWMTP